MLETISYSCLRAFQIFKTLLVRISYLVLIFATSLVYSNLIGLVIYGFINHLLKSIQNKIEIGEYKTLSDFEQWRKFALKCSLFISFIGILISIVYLTLISTCSILFINCEEGYKEDGLRRTKNFSLTLLVASILSLLQEVCELLSIKYRNKSFMDWVFLLALQEQEKLNTGEVDANLESGNLMEDINPNDSVRIHQSIIESGLNQDESIHVVSVHANENGKAYQLNEASEMDEGDVCEHKKKTENENANSLSGYLKEDNDLKESETIQQSINESGLNQDQEHIVASIQSNENEEKNQLNETFERKEGDVNKQTKEKDDENDNSRSDILREDLKESEIIKESINETRLNQHEENFVTKIVSRENKETDQIDGTAEGKDGYAGESSRKAEHKMENSD